MFKGEGVQNKMVMDNAKIQIHEKVQKKLWEADCQVHSIESHTPFSNAAKSAFREFKKGIGHKMTHSPEFWHVHIGAEVIVPIGDQIKTGKVSKCKGIQTDQK